nr:MAG TPA: hypothetical protein [Caudoviricetes sp.]
MSVFTSFIPTSKTFDISHLFSFGGISNFKDIAHFVPPVFS